MKNWARLVHRAVFLSSNNGGLPSKLFNSQNPATRFNRFIFSPSSSSDVSNLNLFNSSPRYSQWDNFRVQRRSMFIQTQSTPNPASLMFYPGTAVMEAGSADFPNACSAMSSPLAKTLFGIDAMYWQITLGFLTTFLERAYKSIRPPSLRIQDPIQGPRIKLRDGRYLSYKEGGVPKDKANYNIIFVHGFGACKHDYFMGSAELVEKLGIHVVHFDRPGYGESDPDPKRTIKSLVLDIEELADKLGLGSKFYIIGASMGGQPVWGCLNYIPHRLAGAALISPVVNYWWPSFPSNLATQEYSKELVQDQWALQVAHYAPWLVYWWNTQKWFPPHSIIAGNAKLTEPDLQLLSKLSLEPVNWEYATQQGVHESLHRDLMVGFGKWEFDPMDVDDPFPGGEGRVHVWQGAEDGLVSATLQQYIAKKLPWIQYHEVANAGHMFLAETVVKDAVLNALLTSNT